MEQIATADNAPIEGAGSLCPKGVSLDGVADEKTGRGNLALTCLDDLIELNPEDADILQAMRQEGVVLDLDRSRSKHGYFVLITQDPTVAARHDLHDESEILYEE